ncbi:MAG: WhiB family transcriptional regulator [Actinomycetota bacterium]|nr:WhiB family transcriptional regulator [Actinomycetota bacterium]
MIREDGTPAWQFRGACRGEDPALFFAPSHIEHKEERERREGKAKEICGRCPVRGDCLDYALKIREPYGVWGGLNEVERRALLPEQERERAAG